VDTGEKLGAAVSSLASGLDRVRQELVRPGEPPSLSEGEARVDRQCEPRRARARKQGDSSLEQVCRGGGVDSRERTPPGCPEVLGCLAADRARSLVQRAELLPVVVRLLQVIADDLLVLPGLVRSARLQPRREASRTSK
jgi:hypothetical protein